MNNNTDSKLKAGPMQRFGDYVLMGEIAEGGMGVVYNARQVSLNRKVALKMIRSGRLASASEIARFRTEVEAAAALAHPHIVRVHEVGEHEGHPFVSMELIEGDSLAEQLGEGRWSLKPANIEERQRDVARLLVKVARAVHHAHQRGVIHRDLKPANILLDEQGSPFLTDFGLAKLVEQDRGQTQDRAILGTPAYMAPEQARGGAKHVTTAADIYSLGAILYELLTSLPPFTGSSPLEILEHVRSKEPLRPRSLNPALDRDLETICLKCLEKEPARRYASAEDLALELERWLAGEPILARPVGQWERAWKWGRRNPILAFSGAAVLLSLLAGLLVSSWQWNRAERERRQTQEANTLLRLQQVEDHFASDRVDTALAALARLLREQPDNRIAAERLVNALRQRVFFLPSDAPPFPPAASLAASPREHFRVEALEDLSIQVQDVRTGQAIFKIPKAHDNVIRDARLSSDGRRLISAAADSTARVWDMTDKQLLLTLKHADTVHHAEFSQDGSRIVTASQDGTARLWNATNGLPLGASMTHRGSVNTARFSPDGKLVITASDDRTLRLWLAASGQPVSDSLRLSDAVDDAWFDPNRSHVIARLGTGQELVFKLTSGLTLISGKPETIEPPPESAIQARLRQQLAPLHDQEITVIDLSSNGQLAATGSLDRSARIWDVRTGRPVTEQLEHDGTVNCARFSPDALRLVTSTASRKVRVWDVRTGQPLCDSIQSAEPVAAVRFDSTGHSILTAAGWRWEPHVASGPVPPWLPELAETVGGQRLQEGRTPTRVAAAEFLRLRDELLRKPETGLLMAWAKRFVADENQPFSQ